MRYDDLVGGRPAGLVPRYQPPAQPGLDRQLARSMVLADLGPHPLVIAAVREVFPRMASQRDRAALMEALAQDPAEALRSVLTSFRVGSALRSLIFQAIDAQERA